MPIWVVVVEGQVSVRTSHRRATGWYGHAVEGGRTRIDVPGLAADVAVVDVGAEDEALRTAIDDAYHRKYGRAGESRLRTRRPPRSDSTSVAERALIRCFAAAGATLRA